MPEWLQALSAAVGGGAFTLFVQWLTQRWAHAGAARLAERAEAFEKRKEQKQLALELLLRIERHCSEVGARRSRGMDAPSYVDDPLETLREEIATHSEGLADPLARRHLDSIDTALRWVRDPGWPVHTSPQPIKLAARAVLGAIQRGEAIPQTLPMLADVLNAAAEWHSEMEARIEAQEEYAKELRGREIQERRQAREAQETAKRNAPEASAATKPAVRVAEGLSDDVGATRAEDLAADEAPPVAKKSSADA